MGSDCAVGHWLRDSQWPARISPSHRRLPNAERPLTQSGSPLSSYRVFTEFSMTWQSLANRCYPLSPSFTEFYQELLGFTTVCVVQVLVTGFCTALVLFYRTLLGFIQFYWVLPIVA